MQRFSTAVAMGRDAFFEGIVKSNFNLQSELKSGNDGQDPFYQLAASYQYDNAYICSPYVLYLEFVHFSR